MSDLSPQTPDSFQTIKNWPHAVGFIGLGNMGWPMAANLRQKLPQETTLYVYDVIQSLVKEFVDDPDGKSGNCQVSSCESSHEVADKSEVIFVIVPEGKHVRSVFLDPGGLLSHPEEALARKTFIDCSTIDPATSLSIADAVRSASPDARFYDAPVSGGVNGAAAATLTFMVGASPDESVDTHFHQRIKPLVRLMGTNVFCLGGPSLGLVAKLSNNYLSGIIAIATSEAMNIGMRHGIDPKLLRECFKNSSGGNWVNDTTNPVPGVCPNSAPSRGYQGGFKVQLMLKDFSLAVSAAENVGARLVLGDAGLSTYREASEDERCKDLDSRVVYRWLGGKE